MLEKKKTLPKCNNKESVIAFEMCFCLEGEKRWLKFKELCPETKEKNELNRQ